MGFCVTKKGSFGDEVERLGVSLLGKLSLFCAEATKNGLPGGRECSSSFAGDFALHPRIPRRAAIVSGTAVVGREQD